MYNLLKFNMHTPVTYHFNKDNEYIHYPKELFCNAIVLKENNSSFNLMRKAWMGTHMDSDLAPNGFMQFSGSLNVSRP